MKRILQALDGASTKPVEGVNDMTKFLRTVSEADIPQMPPQQPAQQQVPPMPDVSDLQPGTSKDGGEGSKITKNADGTVSYTGAWGTYVYNAQGQHVNTISPRVGGFQQTTNAQGQVTDKSYNSGDLNIQQGQQGTTASYTMGDKTVTQATNPQGQVTQQTVQENSLSKFLSIVDKNNFISERIDPQLGDVGDLTPDDIANIQDPNAFEWRQLQGQIADATAKGINPAEIAKLQTKADQLAGPNKDAWLKTLANYQAQQDADNAAGYNNNVRYVQEIQQLNLSGYNSSYLEKIVIANTPLNGIPPAQALEELRKRVGSQDPHEPPPSPEFVKKYLTPKRLKEGTNPHKVSLPVQMAMQHYQQPKKASVKKDSIISKYFVEASEAMVEKEQERKQHIRQYASIIAERVRLKENFNSAISPNAGFKPTAGPGVQSNEPVEEAPIAMDPAEPNNPMIHGHEKANPMTLKGRIMATRRQLKELAQLAESDDLIIWEKITRLAKGGMFMGLEQNLEQIRHGITELAAKRKKGGIQSRGIDKNIG